MASADLYLQARINRLVRGERQAEDVTRILLALRDLPHVGQSIVELGNFAAHSGARAKGAVTQQAKSFFSAMKWTLLAIRTPKLNLNIHEAPEELLDVLQRNVDHLQKEILKEAGLKARAANSMVKTICKRAREVRPGWVDLRTLSPDELRLLNTLTARLVVYPAYTLDSIYKDFEQALSKNGLIAGGDRRQLRQSRKRLGLWAIANLHLCSVDMGNGQIAQLRAGVADGCLSVLVLVPTSNERVLAAQSYILTELKAEECCFPPLLFGDGAERPLQVTDRDRLIPL